MDCWSSVFGVDRDFYPQNDVKTGSGANLAFSQMESGATYCNVKLTTHFHIVPKCDYAEAQVISHQVQSQGSPYAICCE